MTTFANTLKIPIILYVLLQSIIITDGKFFRFDYTYHKELQGWLKFNHVPATWYEARLHCQLEGAVLASPLNENFMAAINNTSIDIFIGIHASISKGDYSSIEGVPLERIPLPWAAGEPDNCDNNEECLIIKKDGTVADVRCDEVFPYMCYKGNKNIGFITNCGTTDKGYILNEETGSCYKFHRIGRLWSRAYKTCNLEGGYLAIINNENEAQVLKDLYAKYPDSNIRASVKQVALLGFYDLDKSGTWNTIQGQPIEEAGYVRWSNGQPDNSTAGQYCGAIFRNALFDDMWCYLSAPFICEKDPQSLLDHDTEKLFKK